MGQNILITGAAGYIGGSVLADFTSRASGPIASANIAAVVRSKEQVEAVSKLGINVVQVDLSDEAGVKDAVLRNEIDIVVHTASSMVALFSSHLIKALGERRKASQKEVYFIQSSVSTIFAEAGGWPFGECKDSDPKIFEKEKQIKKGHPVRDTNILIVEESKAYGVTSINVPIPLVYGRGTGECRKLSVSIPAYIRTSIANKTVYKFDTDARSPAAHISDLTALYALLVDKIMQKELISTGENGYYFAIAHRAPSWAMMERIAKVLYARGLVAEPKVQLWPSDEMAAESLGFPLKYLRAMTTTTGDLVPERAFQVGWQPKWDEVRFLGSIEDEVTDVLELDTVKPTVFSSLMSDGK